MATITEAILKRKIANLNRQFGFKGRKLKRGKTTKKLIITGSGFGLDWGYGGVQIVFQPKGGTTERDISTRLKKKEAAQFIDALSNGARYWQNRTKLK